MKRRRSRRGGKERERRGGGRGGGGRGGGGPRVGGLKEEETTEGRKVTQAWSLMHSPLPPRPYSQGACCMPLPRRHSIAASPPPTFRRLLHVHLSAKPHPSLVIRFSLFVIRFPLFLNFPVISLRDGFRNSSSFTFHLPSKLVSSRVSCFLAQVPTYFSLLHLYA